MKKKTAFFTVISLILLTTLILSIVSLSASAATVDPMQDDGYAAISSSVVQTGWGSEADADADADADVPEPNDTLDDITMLLIILVSMSIAAFGALAFKLFSNRISQRELVNLLLVLIFVLIVILIALYMIYVGKSGSGFGEAAALIDESIFGEVI